MPAHTSLLFASLPALWLSVSLCAAEAPRMDLDAVAFKVRFGAAAEPAAWDGSLTVTPGKVLRLAGWRFEQTDAITDNTWKIATRRMRPTSRRQREIGRANLPVVDNGFIASLGGVTPQSVVKITTKQGDFAFKVGDLKTGQKTRFLNRQVEVERVACSQQLTSAPTEEDYPAAAVAPDGTVYLAYLAFTPAFASRPIINEEPADFSFLRKQTGGDQLWLLSMKDAQWSEPIAVTSAGEDLYRPAIAVDGQGRAWIFYSRNTGANANLNSGDWELFARSFADGKLGTEVRLTSEPYADAFPAAATDAAGRVWVTWQAFRGSNARILAVRQTDSGFGSPEVVADTPANEWAPALAAARDGRVTIAWDTYQKGDYDVYTRTWKNGTWASPKPVAASLRFEARPAVAYDGDDRLWVAWEEAAENWGKDFGPLEQYAVPLYQQRDIVVKAFVGDQAFVPATPVSETLRPALGPKAKARVKRGPKLAMPRLSVDARGNLWLAARVNNPTWRTTAGTFWSEYITHVTAEGWAKRTYVPDSDNLLDNRPSLVALGDKMLLIGSCDNRRKVRPARGFRSGAPRMVLNNQLFATALAAPRERLAPELKAVPAEKPAAPAPATEPADVQRLRAYRALIAEKPAQIRRGEFHRHTEISPDGGNDGALLDMWRYGIDVAAFDWIGNGDHDNGMGREYSWWTIQKTTDLFQVGNSFTPMFTYERSNPYPDGHRNVMFDYRGVRPLGRLVNGLGKARDDLPATAKRPNTPDTQMLYKYLKFFDGVCASHTSGTGMGTDWRDNDPEVEPFVEIYQGDRQSYEMPGAPRAVSAEYAIPDFRPLGFVSLALQKGYRLAFQASSDHVSTHMSYCNVWTEQPTRTGILSALKRRHVYGSTDNIVADLRCTADGKDYFMGDEFSTSQPPTLQVKLQGSQPFARVVIIRDNEYVYSVNPNKALVDFTWRDPNPTRGKTSYYYVRGEQADGELVWVSPLWIRYQG